jgi:hypothetical protein
VQVSSSADLGEDDGISGFAPAVTFAEQDPTSALALAPIGADGGIMVRNDSAASVSFTVDLEGYFSAVSDGVNENRWLIVRQHPDGDGRDAVL